MATYSSHRLIMGKEDLDRENVKKNSSQKP